MLHDVYRKIVHCLPWYTLIRGMVQLLPASVNCSVCDGDQWDIVNGLVQV